MVDGAYQVGPAPPFRRFDVCFRARSLFQEEELPNPDQRTPAEWEAQVVLAVRLVDRRLRAEEGPQVADVVVPHGGIGGVRKRRIVGRTVRSEEHTSELQSLMRISYAVFCLKKKKHRQND